MGKHFVPNADIVTVSLRPDVLVRIQGLPHDLRPNEANRVARVVQAFASFDEKPVPALTPSGRE